MERVLCTFRSGNGRFHLSLTIKLKGKQKCDPASDHCPLERHHSPAGRDSMLAHSSCPLAQAGSDRDPPCSIWAIFPSSHPFPNSTAEHCTTKRLCFSGPKHKHISEAH